MPVLQTRGSRYAEKDHGCVWGGGYCRLLCQCPSYFCRVCTEKPQTPFPCAVWMRTLSFPVSGLLLSLSGTAHHDLSQTNTMLLQVNYKFLHDRLKQVSTKDTLISSTPTCCLYRKSLQIRPINGVECHTKKLADPDKDGRSPWAWQHTQLRCCHLPCAVMPNKNY